LSAYDPFPVHATSCHMGHVTENVFAHRGTTYYVFITGITLRREVREKERWRGEERRKEEKGQGQPRKRTCSNSNVARASQQARHTYMHIVHVLWYIITPTALLSHAHITSQHSQHSQHLLALTLNYVDSLFFPSR